MGNMSFIDALIDKRLKDLHCGYIGKVISTDGDTATVQPLGLIKEYGSTATKVQAVIEDVPVACKYKLATKNIKDGDGNTVTVAVPAQLAKGDLVVCLCADRDINDARHGRNELPPEGAHSISDSIIVGIL